TALRVIAMRVPPLTPFLPYTTLFRSASPWRRQAPDFGDFWIAGKNGARQRGRAALPVACAGAWRGAKRDIVRSHQLRHSELESRSEEHTSELQSRENLVCRLLLEKKK